MGFIDLSKAQTEGQNPRTTSIDQVSTQDLCYLINAEDALVAGSVVPCIPHIAGAIDALAKRVRLGGRVIYVGAGTSGRLGVLDASEIPPTYSASNDQFIALIAGGDRAIRSAKEGAEDDSEEGLKDLVALNLNPELDSMIGIAASGRTPYVLGCLQYAKSLGCATIGIACAEPSVMGTSGSVDFMISPITGPEAVTGSTRMKAGTATKLVLNMLSTGTMIRVGKTHGNMMVDLKATNLKLKQRSRNMIRIILGSSCPSTDEELDYVLTRCDGSVKLSIATIALGSKPEDAQKALDLGDGKLATVLANAAKSVSDGIENSNLDQAAKDIISDPLVMYVDGGGTKCAAVVMNPQGDFGEGEAGSCNVIDADLGASLASIRLAAQRALDSLSRKHHSSQQLSIQSVKFAAVWVGLAGFDRPDVKARLEPELLDTFQFTRDGALNLANDIEVLVSAGNSSAGQKNSSVISLVAGTGSIAIRYVRDASSDSGWVRDTRSGGWGHMLGDDGSGYDLGRQAIRSTLYALDELRAMTPENSRHLSAETVRKHLSPLSQRVLEHFDLNVPDSNNYDLSSLLTSNSNGNPKYKIAQVARLVLESHSQQGQSPCPDENAEEIISTGIAGLMRTIKPLVRSPFGPSNSTLVLSGGLLASENDVYRSALLGKLNSEGINFGEVKTIRNPARLGAEALTKRYFSQN